MRNKGFTLIEITITISIIIFLISIGIVSYRSFEKSTELENTCQDILSVLKIAQTKTIASDEASQYGVHFEDDRYILFKGNEYQSGSESNKIYNISDRLEIYDISLSDEGNDIIFQRISGKTEQYGNISLRIILSPSENKAINISSFGLVEIYNETECCQNNRIADTRHIHLNMGWSIQNSLVLTLSFPDYPESNTNIDMADYFNAAKTEFSWSGSVNVNGKDQEIEIKTHSLDELNTILCIHRPKDANTESVNILIDSKNIILYNINGEISVGPYGGTLEVQ